MDFFEKDLEDILFESNPDDLIERGFHHMSRFKKRQVRIGAYGIADIIGVHRNPNSNQLIFRVYELKRNKVNQESIIQCIRYMHGLYRYLIKKRYGDLSKYLISIHGVVVGGEVRTDTDLIYLPDMIGRYDGIFQMQLFTYNYKVDGIRFQQHSYYKLAEEGF